MEVDSLWYRALRFGITAHHGQVRKYTGEPYILHPMEVATIVCGVRHTEAMLAAALLHDVVENTDATIGDIDLHFGAEVAELVGWLTDVSTPSDGNRAARKALDRAHLAAASVAAQTIKAADLISNTRSIKQHDPNFWRVYRREKMALLAVMDKADPSLMKEALALCEGD